MRSALLLCLLWATAPGLAQEPATPTPPHHHHHGHPHPGTADAPTPPHAHGEHSHAAYAGLQERQIKALSEQQIEDLQEGRGMSMALAAELNGYPGPLHTLELARELALTPEQEKRTRALFVEMQHEARVLGRQLVASEEALDRLFRDGEATADSVSALVQDAATLQGQLRAHHLLYHLRMLEVLTPEQVERYNGVRGYR